MKKVALLTAMLMVSTAIPAHAFDFRYFHHWKPPHHYYPKPPKVPAPKVEPLKTGTHGQFAKQTAPFIFACVGSVVGAAMYANFVNNRELTFDEAASCGVTHWLGGMNTPRGAEHVSGTINTCGATGYKMPGQRHCVY